MAVNPSTSTSFVDVNITADDESSSEKEQNERNLQRQILSYWSIPLSFSYYLIISPFRLGTQNNLEDGDKLVLHTSCFQTILWVVMTLSNLLVVFAEIELYWMKTYYGGPTPEFVKEEMKHSLPDVYSLIDTVSLTVHICSIYLFVWFSWKNRLKLTNLFAVLVENAQLLGINKQNGLRRRTLVIITVATFLKPISEIFKCMEAANGDMKLGFWLAFNESMILRIITDIPETTVGFSAFFLYFQLTLFNFTDAFCALTVLLMGMYVNAFLAKLNHGLSPYQVIHLYRILKQTSYVINQFSQILFIGFLIGSICYYPYAILGLLEVKLISAKIFIFMNLTFHWTLWFYAAAINKRMATLEKWLSAAGSYSSLKPNDLQMLLYDVGKNEIGIFPFKSVLINHGFCKSLLGIVIMYTITLVQFRPAPLLST